MGLSSIRCLIRLEVRFRLVVGIRMDTGSILLLQRIQLGSQTGQIDVCAHRKHEIKIGCILVVLGIIRGKLNQYSLAACVVNNTVTDVLAGP